MLDPNLSAFLQSWDFEPTILVGLGLAAGLYGVGLRRIWQRAGSGAAVSAWRAAAFGSGLLAVFLALQSPIATFSTLLFSMHMVQHLLLTLVGAPLIVLGYPLLPTLWALPLGARRDVARLFAAGSPLHAAANWLTRPAPAVAIYTGTILVWHIPALYDASLRSDAVHYLQHATFFGTALLFWWTVFQPVPGRRAMSHGRALLAIIATTVFQEKLLGGLLTFADLPLYRRYTEVPRVWGLSVMEDQNLAGLLMMVGGFFYFALVFTIIFFAWFAHEERETARQEGRAGAEGQAAGTGALDLLREAVAGAAGPAGESRLRPTPGQRRLS